jgi:hypothetical protein
MVHSLNVQKFQDTSYSDHSEKSVYTAFAISEHINWNDSYKIRDETAFKNIVLSN